MSYIQFDKLQLINLEFMLGRELIRSNRGGAFACQTIICCNTRKYHGLLNVEQPDIDGEHHILLSGLDETIIQHDTAFNFGIHRYKGGEFSPKGHKYIRDFIAEPIPKLVYRVGGVVLSKEMVLNSKADQMLIKYTLVEAHSETTLRLKPYLAFRNIHSLTKCNDNANVGFISVKNGIKMCLYDGYTPLYLQISKENKYTHFPDWYNNIEYVEEINRGYDAHEDLLVSGSFEVSIKKGESIIFSASTSEISDTSLLKKVYLTEIKNRIPRNSFENNLCNAAQQLIINHNNKTEIIAGYPWYGRSGRETFMSLPGLVLLTGDFKSAKKIFDTMLSELNGSLFPNYGIGKNTNYESVDAPLWFFWALQQYVEFITTETNIWKEYGNYIKQILEGYKKGTLYNIKMLENGLLCCGDENSTLTWMNARVNGKPVTSRCGCAVEVNALWYNAIMFSIEKAKLAKDKQFVSEWQAIADNFPDVFKDTFWSKEKGYLCDTVYNGLRDWTVRPNMIIATSLPYSPISSKISELVLEKAKIELLTERGLRTLTPEHPDYIGNYSGNEVEREKAHHQGSVFPWLFGHFAEGYLKVHGISKLSFIKRQYALFEETIREHGIGTISELYDGNPPYKAGGAISYSTSVAELLRVNFIINKYETENPQL